MENIKMKKKYTFGAIVIGLVLVIAIGLGVMFLLKDDKKEPVENKTDNPPQDTSIKIVDLNSNKRPIAVPT